jgi:hypothetical protein
VFAELAARLIDATFSTAPPNLTTPIRLMRPTRPVEVFLFRIFFGAIFANLTEIFNPTFA